MRAPHQTFGLERRPALPRAPARVAVLDEEQIDAPRMMCSSLATARGRRPCASDARAVLLARSRSIHWRPSQLSSAWRDDTEGSSMCTSQRPARPSVTRGAVISTVLQRPPCTTSSRGCVGGRSGCWSPRTALPGSAAGRSRLRMKVLSASRMSARFAHSSTWQSSTGRSLAARSVGPAANTEPLVLPRSLATVLPEFSMRLVTERVSRPDVLSGSGRRERPLSATSFTSDAQAPSVQAVSRRRHRPLHRAIASTSRGSCTPGRSNDAEITTLAAQQAATVHSSRRSADPVESCPARSRRDTGPAVSRLVGVTLARLRRPEPRSRRDHAEAAIAVRTALARARAPRPLACAPGRTSSSACRSCRWR